MIPLDLSNAEQLAYWRTRNPEAVAMADVMEMKGGDAATAFVCQVGYLPGCARWQVTGWRDGAVQEC